MQNNFKSKSIKIEDLTLWDDNARFPDNYSEATEKELVDYFLSDKNFKIEILLESIVEDIDLPQLEKLVVWQDGENNIVLEGNRRLTCYKILKNPSLIDARYAKLIQKVKNLRNTNIISIQLECLCSDEKNDCFRYIDRKHNNGNNEVNWNEPERINYSIRRGAESQNNKLKIAITNFVKNLDFPEELKSKVLGKGYVTTFFRFVATGPAKEVFRLSTDENGDLLFTDLKFTEKLKVIIYNVLKKEDFDGNTVDSRELNKNPNILNYLKKVKAEDLIKVNQDIEKIIEQDLFGKNIMDIGKPNIVSKATPRKTPKTKNNEILFGKTLVLKKGKVNDLYRAILTIYEKSHVENSILPIIGMSMRLVTEVAARVHYDETYPKKAKSDQLYKDFLKKAKKEMALNQQSKAYVSLTKDWLDSTNNLEGLLGKYAHGNIQVSQNDVLQSSIIIGEILEHYFKK